MLGRFIGECGPVSRYLGLLTAPHDRESARVHFEEAARVSEELGARIWMERVEKDIALLF